MRDSIRTIGIVVTNKHQIGSFFFFRFQVASRHLHEREHQIYVNSFRLQKKRSFATIWMDKTKQEIHFVLQGISITVNSDRDRRKPSKDMESNRENFKRPDFRFSRDETEVLLPMPQCILEECGTSKLINLPGKILEDKFPMNEKEVRETYLCKKGHSSPADWVRLGIRETEKNRNQKSLEFTDFTDCCSEFCQDIVESLEKLVQNGKELLIDLSPEEFNEFFIFNSRLREVLTPVWFTFGCYFVEQLSKVEINLIKDYPVSQSEHLTILLMKLQNSTEKISIAQFLNALEKTAL